MAHQLPKLNYPYDALEPYIDAKTMEIHHTKHHQTYTDKMNAILEKYPDLADKDPKEIMKDLDNSKLVDKDRQAFINHGGGFINHSLFWEVMGPKKEVDQNLAAEIEKTFGSVEAFKEKFSEVAKNHFGSGWAWLVKEKTGQLQIYSTANQESPYLQGHQPIICLDIWEHAYYLKYQNRRAEYIDNWWQVLKLI
ncbi:MAG: superoxide dismutase [Candidatus Buchananbacteria bacterium RIFCSPHIGHO2_01_FULL_44_11]|uniref:Superoxide dismutase n=1 Tax=Candidatus Buchananbacteria bacterium RIFCSPHIGHO2_01_FULL_44_11 TaxID=1797535 RepID=A0A1G1Y4F1_9BACT|nr:MAG: superoxide dismutase [Candidatus Buchananbacteria bacterium RIFCSPHIGHO2_01_FULL_44_11]